MEQKETDRLPEKKRMTDEELLRHVGSTGGGAMLGAALAGAPGAVGGAVIGFLLGRRANKNKRDSQENSNPG